MSELTIRGENSKIRDKMTLYPVKLGKRPPRMAYVKLKIQKTVF